MKRRDITIRSARKDQVAATVWQNTASAPLEALCR
jgi:hypothetical protein